MVAVRQVGALRLRAISEPGRTLIVSRGGRALARVRFEPARREQQVELSLAQACDPLIVLETVGVRQSDEQRRNGDARELGVFVRAIEVRDGERWRELDLAVEPVERGFGVTLDLDRFRLPFNRRAVRAADGFLVHSNFVARKLLAIRDAPVGVVHHGARPRWSDDDRRAERARLGLPERFQRGFLITNFGHVQRHKRVDKLLEALALARRERGDVHAAIVGTLQPQFFDARAFAHGLGLDDAVLFTDHQPEEVAWRWIHAGDVAVQLRGPSTGGTSGGVFQSLSLGRAVIASDLDEQRELPDSCVLKVSTDDREVVDLARTLIGLRDEPARRDELERAARAFVETECSWPRVARRYHELLRVQPRVRGR